MSKKKLDLDNIQPLPEHLRKQVYGDDYNDTWKLRYSDLSDSEKRTLGTFLKYQEAEEIYWVPEVDSPSGKHSPDLLIDGVRVEIKSVSTVQSIIDQVRKASKQIGVDGILLIDASESKLNNHDILHNSMMRANYYNLRAFFAITSSSECFYQIKKGDSSTAAKRGHDHESPYTSILPNPGKKSSEFYIIQKRRFIHRKLQVLATMNRLMFLSYQTLGKSQSSSEIYPITFREYVGYINTKKYSQMKGKSGAIR